MAEQNKSSCSGNCSSCSSNCAERDPKSLIEPTKEVNHIKKVIGVVSGKGGVGKSMVTSLLKLKEAPKPDDTADALAIALCHAQSSNSLMAKYYNK